MNKNIADYIKTRHSVKSFKTDEKISNTDLEKIKELLRYPASSVNLQPWHFIIAQSQEAKNKIAKATEIYPFNTQAILDASHVIVFCVKKDVSEEYLLKILSQEEKDGRFLAKPEYKDMNHNARSMFVNIHKNDIKDLESWMAKQVYINVGSFLLGVAALEIDSLPMEGIQADVLDNEFNLTEQGYTSLVVVPIGYANKEQDYNAKLPKSRLEYNEIITQV